MQERVEISIPLFDRQSRPVWLQHRSFENERSDLALVDVTSKLKKLAPGKRFLNEYGFVQMFSYVGMQIFVTGYSLSNFDQWMPATWKSGTLATEPAIPVDDKSMFLVDAATTPGMSGSPIFRRVFGPAAMADMSFKLDSIVTTEFVGVYAGRLQSSNLESVNLGYAWYGNLIEEIIASPSKGITC